MKGSARWQIRVGLLAALLAISALALNLWVLPSLERSLIKQARAEGLLLAYGSLRRHGLSLEISNLALTYSRTPFPIPVVVERVLLTPQYLKLLSSAPAIEVKMEAYQGTVSGMLQLKGWREFVFSNFAGHSLNLAAYPLLQGAGVKQGKLSFQIPLIDLTKEAGAFRMMVTDFSLPLPPRLGPLQGRVPQVTNLWAKLTGTWQGDQLIIDSLRTRSSLGDLTLDQGLWSRRSRRFSGSGKLLSTAAGRSWLQGLQLKSLETIDLLGEVRFTADSNRRELIEFE